MKVTLKLESCNLMLDLSTLSLEMREKEYNYKRESMRKNFGNQSEDVFDFRSKIIGPIFSGR